MPDLNRLLEEIDRLDQEATPGPWYQGQERIHESPVDVFATRDPEDPDAQDIATYMHSAKDAEFIALARTALPAMSKALQAVIAYCYETIEDAGNYGMADMHLAGQGAQARAIRNIITKTLGADDD